LDTAFPSESHLTSRGVPLQDGVVMGGDSRSTAGNIIADKGVLKVHKLSETIYACGAGTSADLNKVVHLSLHARSWPYRFCSLGD
jgi:20S proteasome alpha/beta subunit